MPPTQKTFDFTVLSEAIAESLRHPLTEKQIESIVSATTALVHILFYEHDPESKRVRDEMLASLKLPASNEPVNLAALGYLSMMFPNLPKEMQIRLISLKPTDL